MSLTHRIPFYINDNGSIRQANQEEFESFKLDPKNKATVTKWTKANRLAEAQHNMAQGDEKNVAWAKAFERYPDIDTKPRFFIK